MFGPLPAFPGSLMSGCAGWGRGPQGLSPVPREGPRKGRGRLAPSGHCFRQVLQIPWEQLAASPQVAHRWPAAGTESARLARPPPTAQICSLLLSRPRDQAQALRVHRKRRATCFYQTLFLLLLSTHPLAPVPKSGLTLPHHHHGEPAPTPATLPSGSSSCLSISSFFCLAQVIVRREKPWSIQFQMLRSSSQRGTKRRGECHIESLQLHLPAAPAPSGSAGGHRVLADSPVAGELLCFQFTVRLNLQRLTRLIYFVADGVRKARSEIWVRFFAVTHNTAESAGSRRQLGASLRAWTCGPACVSSGFRSPARAERPRRRFSPGPADLCSRQWVREALAEFEHELGAKLRPYLTLARLWPFSSLPSTTLAHLGPGCPLLINSPPSHKNTLTVVSGFGKSITLPSARPGGASGSRPSSGHSLWILGPLWQHF